MSRGRKSIDVDPEEFQQVIRDIESSYEPQSRNELWKLVASSEWAQTRKPRALSAQTAMTRAGKMNLEIKTPKGKRGKEKGSGPVNKSGKRRDKSFPPETAEKLRVVYNVLGEKTVEDLVAGKLRAVIKAKCYDCAGGVKSEVAKCPAIDCPLWTNRPWKQKKAPKVPEKEMLSDENE
jgi:hypothetical protein